MSKFAHAKPVEGFYIDAGDRRAYALAELFCDMTADQMADFFNQVCHLSSEWPGQRIFQWREMEIYLQRSARGMLKEMHDHTGDD